MDDYKLASLTLDKITSRWSRSKYRDLPNFASFRLTRRQRRPQNYVGPLPKPSKLKQLRKKERFTWYQWLCDWRTSLHKMGFVSRADLIPSLRSSPTNTGDRRKESLCMVKGDTAIFLYASVHALPKGEIVNLGAFSRVYHLVRGRRPDSTLGVRRLDVTTAMGILPDVDLRGLGHFLVEFDGDLFESKDGGWKKAKDDAVLWLYCDYRANSTHWRSIRPYQKAHQNEPFEPVTCPGSFSAFDDYTPRFVPIKELK